MAKVIKRIRGWFTEHYEKNKKVKSVEILAEMKRPCRYCGYGEDYICKVILEDDSSAEDSSAEESTNDSQDSNEVKVCYWTGCLSYSEDMQILSSPDSSC